MDKYYGNVCELDIIFNFQKAYFILDELLLAGEMQESSKKNVLRCISQQDSLEDMEVSCWSLLFMSPSLFPPTKNSLPVMQAGHGLLRAFLAVCGVHAALLSCPGAIGLMLPAPRLRKMWSPRSCSDPDPASSLFRLFSWPWSLGFVFFVSFYRIVRNILFIFEA